MTDSELEQLFFNHLRVERQLSDLTLKSYTRDLKLVREKILNLGCSGWLALTDRPLRRAISELHESGLSGRSLQRMLSAVRSFYRFLNRDALCDHNPANTVQAPKVARRLPQTLNVQQLEPILDIETDDPLELRDLAMMELLYSSGIRVSELVGIDISDIDLKQSELRVTGKGNKMRQVPVGSKAREAVLRWLTTRELLVKPDEAALFVSKQGGRLTTRSVEQRLRRWGALGGVAGRLYPHRLRHSFATDMLAGSGDLRAVQEMLGHADISTTQIYTHLDFKQLKSIYDQSHPRAKKQKDD